MDRLTGKDELGYYAPRNETLYCLKQRGEITDRLAEYEDTGFSPEELKECISDDILKVARSLRKMIESGEMDKVEDLLKAEAEGRLIVVPCKARGKVWLIEWWNRRGEWEKLSAPINRNVIYFSIEVDGVYAHFKEGALNTKYFGKTVFLTREEAEAALEGESKC